MSKRFQLRSTPLLAVDHHPDGRIAATTLGDVERVDLAPLEQPYCQLMSEVWRTVPVAWSEGHSVVWSVPDDHVCSSGAR